MKPPWIISLEPYWTRSVIHFVQAVEIWVGSERTQPAKMMTEMPFPRPFSVIWSPSHMASIAPARRTVTI